MTAFQDRPIRQKLIIALMIVTGSALLLAGLGVIVSDQILYRSYIRRDLTALARIIAENSTAALAFDDSQAAAETLRALRARPHLEIACIYRVDGTSLAKYVRADVGVPCPPAAGGEEITFATSDAFVSEPVILNGRRVGTLVFRYDLLELWDRIRLYGAIVFGVLLASSLVAFLLSSRLRDAIATPLLRLTEAVRHISQTRDYRVRARKLSQDELGVLVDGFNDMLASIEARDAELLQAREQLEQRVQQRTEELRLSEERFRLLVDRVEEYAIFMLDPAGNITSWNIGAERIMGCPGSEIMGRNFSIFYPPEALAEKKPETELRVAAAQGRVEDDGWRVRKDGTRFWANTIITALRDPAGKLIGFSKITRDQTERRRAEEALKQQAEELARSNAELQQFAYVASHDLQEPLRMVISYMQIISEQYKGKLDADADEFIGYAVDGAMRMRQLISDLLEYSRAGTRKADSTPTDSGAILEEVKANLEIAIQESGAVITNDPLPVVMADSLEVAQVLQNLLSNAVKFHGTQPPRVHLSAARDGRFWRFAVSDNGIGIAPEYRERIFVIFQRLHDRVEYPGTGIGLAICKRIIDRLGGRIWVESEPGNGSTFFFTIPAS